MNRITAYDVGVDDGGGYKYSINPKKVAKVLRILADRIDAGEVEAFENFTVMSKANGVDFLRTFIRMSFHEKDGGK